jgi:hypothetical protein
MTLSGEDEMNPTMQARESVSAGRMSTLLCDWVQDNLKHEKLSYVYLKHIHASFFSSCTTKGIRQQDYSLPVFSKILRKVLRENGLLDKCTFKRRKDGIVITGITIVLSTEYEL